MKSMKVTFFFLNCLFRFVFKTYNNTLTIPEGFLYTFVINIYIRTYCHLFSKRLTSFFPFTILILKCLESIVRLIFKKISLKVTSKKKTYYTTTNHIYLLFLKFFVFASCININFQFITYKVACFKNI